RSGGAFAGGVAPRPAGSRPMTGLNLVTEILLGFVALWPIVTAAVWIAGGLLFRLIEEAPLLEEPTGGWRGVTVLLPCYQEAAVIAGAVRAARAVDYPQLEILVLDEGSTDATSQ